MRALLKPERVANGQTALAPKTGSKRRGGAYEGRFIANSARRQGVTDRVLPVQFRRAIPLSIWADPKSHIAAGLIDAG